jgi:hypothetical protein
MRSENGSETTRSDKEIQPDDRMDEVKGENK